MIGQRKSRVRSLERRVAELSERLHVLEQHRRVELNRLAVPMTDEMRVDRAFIEAKDLAAQCAREYIATTGLTTPTTPPGFLREGWISDAPLDGPDLRTLSQADMTAMAKRTREDLR